MSGRRHRSAVACQSCRRRKVRCSLTVTGVPCIGCAQDRVECVVDARAKLQRRVPMRCLSSLNNVSPREGSWPPRPSSSSFHNGSSNSQAIRIPSPRPRVLHDEGTPADRERHGEQDTIQDEERNGIEIAAAILGKPERAGQVPFYTSDQIGLTSALNICSPERTLPRHFLIPSYISTSLSDDDREYLDRKGVFTLPGNEACASLLRAYFYHVHPIMPVVEVDHFLNNFHAGRLQEQNILLVWCVFFAAVNFIPVSICQHEGYECRKAMKTAMYSRAKCMYNNGGERDKIVLLQSSLLLGFWHSGMDEHIEPWYWTGIAVSLCQALGLHCDPDSTRYNASITDRQRHLWRRLWWSCFFRDRWLGLTLGRPVRINLNDCDMPMPSAADLLSSVDGLSQEIVDAFLPGDLQQMAQYWVLLIKMSKVLGDVLALNYRAFRPRPLLEQVEALESEIMQCRPPDKYELGLSRPAIFYQYHLQLHYQALLITFYRPYGAEVPDGLHSAYHEEWQHRMRLHADAAASRTNDIVEALAQENLLNFAGPMTPPLLVPAMQTHLLNCKSASPLSRRLRLSKLNMCMMVMEEFQKVYSAASILRGIFTKAIQHLCPEDAVNATTSTVDSTSSATSSSKTGTSKAVCTADVTTTETSAPGNRISPVTLPLEGNLDVSGIISNDSIVDVLMDEASIFNFWGTLGPMN